MCLATSETWLLNNKVENIFCTMAIQGKAAKSATGASMSKYDVEVEGRLKALEAKAHDKCGGDGSGPSAEQWEELWGWYQAVKSRL